MRADWNARAGEDANYYVAFGRRQQDEEEFFATAADVVRVLERELKRFGGREAALEIGCGPGRLMRPMARHFAEVHGVDVSDEMVALARERLRGTPNAHPHVTPGADLGIFPAEKFDFVYSYAVFQHIPSRDVVWNYLREARRVLKPGGVLRCQLNGLPPHSQGYDTWSGVRIGPEELRSFAREGGLELLALEEVWTQYMWVTCRKPGPRPGPPPRETCSIRHITNALTGDRVAPASGPLAALSLWIDSLPHACDLNNLAVSAGEAECRAIYIGPPEPDGVSQVNVWLPEGVRSGLLPVMVSSGGRQLASGWVRIIPGAPPVPRIGSITDAVNLLAGNRIASGLVKVTMSDVVHADRFAAKVDGREAAGVVSFCTDSVMQRYEFNFELPPATAPGPHQVTISLGRREFAPVPIEVV